MGLAHQLAPRSTRAYQSNVNVNEKMKNTNGFSAFCLRQRRHMIFDHIVGSIVKLISAMLSGFGFLQRLL